MFPQQWTPQLEIQVGGRAIGSVFALYQQRVSQQSFPFPGESLKNYFLKYGTTSSPVCAGRVVTKRERPSRWVRQRLEAGG